MRTLSEKEDRSHRTRPEHTLHQLPTALSEATQHLGEWSSLFTPSHETPFRFLPHLKNPNPARPEASKLRVYVREQVVVFQAKRRPLLAAILVNFPSVSRPRGRICIPFLLFRNRPAAVSFRYSQWRLRRFLLSVARVPSGVTGLSCLFLSCLPVS